MRLFPLLLLLTGCSSYIATMQEEKKRYDISYDEMRIEMSDLKHALHATQVELNILEEKVKKQDAILAQNKQPSLNQTLLQQISECEKKINNLHKIQEQIIEDLKNFQSYAQDASHTLQMLSQEIKAQNKKFDELSKIKATLSSLSQTMYGSRDSTNATHRVKSGETLKKIAEMHHTTVAELKKLNKLENDRIVINQELKLP
ncbi:MAG: LysM peptidoglycan-binding domain-containing protein [Chlamydiota bacterium]